MPQSCLCKLHPLKKSSRRLEFLHFHIKQETFTTHIELPNTPQIDVFTAAKWSKQIRPKILDLAKGCCELIMLKMRDLEGLHFLFIACA